MEDVLLTAGGGRQEGGGLEEEMYCLVEDAFSAYYGGHLQLCLMNRLLMEELEAWHVYDLSREEETSPL